MNAIPICSICGSTKFNNDTYRCLKCGSLATHSITEQGKGLTSNYIINTARYPRVMKTFMNFRPSELALIPTAGKRFKTK